MGKQQTPDLFLTSGKKLEVFHQQEQFQKLAWDIHIILFMKYYSPTSLWKIFLLWSVVSCTRRFHIVKHSWNNPHLVMAYYSFNVVLDCIYCLSLIFINMMVYHFLFCGVFVRFWSQCHSSLGFFFFLMNWNALFSMPETI